MDVVLLKSVIKICLEAGKVIMEFYYGRKGFSFHRKKDYSPITSADLVANYYILSSLQKLTPEIPILSEEDKSLWVSDKERIDYFWVVDPLDGTKEFLSRNREFTVNIALIEHGIPVLGVVYVPLMDLLYAGINHQVWKIDTRTQYRSLVSPVKLYPPVIVISRFHNDFVKLKSYLMHLSDYRIVTVGSSLKFCLVAEGRAQMYPRFSCTNIWDIAAGHAIVLSAGVVVNDWYGSSLHYKNVFGSSFLNYGFHVVVY